MYNGPLILSFLLLEKAMECLREMRIEAKLQPNLQIFTTLIDIAGIARKREDISQYINELQSCGTRKREREREKRASGCKGTRSTSSSLLLLISSSVRIQDGYADLQHSHQCSCAPWRSLSCRELLSRYAA